MRARFIILFIVFITALEETLKVPEIFQIDWPSCLDELLFLLFYFCIFLFNHYFTSGPIGKSRTQLHKVGFRPRAPLILMISLEGTMVFNSTCQLEKNNSGYISQNSKVVSELAKRRPSSNI
jgi:hypothetical protein